MEKIKIILVDDELLFRNGIAFLLHRENDMEVIFEAGTGLELIDYLRQAAVIPDIIIMDLKMPGLNGVEATKIVSAAYPDIKIVALTSYNTRAFIANMINTGAASYLVKNTTPANLLTTLRHVAKKGYYFDDLVKDILQNHSKSKCVSFDNWELTGREKEIIRLICMQYNSKEIAETLHINPRTVEGHRNNLLLKTQSKNVAGLVIFALQNDIVSLEDLGV